MGPTPVYGARAEKPPKNADFAMKQTNICRLSGDIKMTTDETKSENRIKSSVNILESLMSSDSSKSQVLK